MNNFFPDPHSSEMQLTTIDRCLIEFDTLYQAGQNPKSADFENQFQNDNRADFVELIYYEFCRLEADGLEPDRLQFMTDYYDYKAELEKLFCIHFGLGLTTFQNNDHPANIKPDLAKMPETGDSIGPFQLIKILGQGAMGRVFLALQTDLGDRKVVLKITVSGPSDESELMSRVIHPNVMTVFRHFRTVDHGFDVIVMPYIPGASLDQLLTKSNPSKGKAIVRPNRMSPIRVVDIRPELSRIGREIDGQGGADLNPNRDFIERETPAARTWPDQVRIWAEDLSEALFAAYHQGVIHGDIKPGNIYMGVNCSTYLLDFHLARKWRFEKYRRVTDQKDPGGTLYYMPPERLIRFAETVEDDTKNNHIIKAHELHRGDLYSLGLVILEILTGYDPAIAAPFPEADPAIQARRIAQNRQHPEWLQDWPGFRRLSKSWRVILSKVLASEIADRYEDGKSFAEALRTMKRRSSDVTGFRLTQRALAIAFCFVVISAGFVFVQSSRSHYATSVKNLWNLPDHLSIDPSITTDQPLAVRIKSARLQLLQARNEHPEIWVRSKIRNLLQPKTAQLDSEIWLMDRMDSLVSALMKRASISNHREDLQSVSVIIMEAIQRWDSSNWKALAAQLNAINTNRQNLKLTDTTRKDLNDYANQELLKVYSEASKDQGKSQSTGLRIWKQMIDESPDSFGIRWGFVRYLVNHDRKSQAIEQLEVLKKLAPEHFELRRLLAFLKYQTGAFHPALEEVELANQYRADDLSALRLRAILRVLNGQKQELIAEVSRIGELIDEDHKGSLFLEQNRLETERLVGNINQELNPDHSRKIFDLSTLQSIAAIMPDDPEVLNLLMHQYFRENQIDDAIQVMERIATIKPDSIQVQINLSVLYKIDGNIDQSVKTALKVLSRQEISGWLKYQNTAVNHFIDLCELRKKSDLNQAVAICELLASQCEITGLGKGECYYEMARLNIAKSGLSGVPDALGNLIKSGQQNQGYLMKWYPQDENFKPYRARLDQELIKVFPKFSFETQPKP